MWEGGMGVLTRPGEGGGWVMGVHTRPGGGGYGGTHQVRVRQLLGEDAHGALEDVGDNGCGHRERCRTEGRRERPGMGWQRGDVGHGGGRGVTKGGRGVIEGHGGGRGVNGGVKWGGRGVTWGSTGVTWGVGVAEG